MVGRVAQQRGRCPLCELVPGLGYRASDVDTEAVNGPNQVVGESRGAGTDVRLRDEQLHVGLPI